jgi:hypothetical protein
MAFLYTKRLVFGIFFRSPFSPCRGGAGVIFVETMGSMFVFREKSWNFPVYLLYLRHITQ